MILPLMLQSAILLLAVPIEIPSNNYAFARHHHHNSSASPTSSQESNNTGNASCVQESNSNMTTGAAPSNMTTGATPSNMTTGGLPLT